MKSSPDKGDLLGTLLFFLTKLWAILFKKYTYTVARHFSSFMNIILMTTSEKKKHNKISALQLLFSVDFKGQKVF